MADMKSIYFPPPVADEEIRAILEDRKTVTRRSPFQTEDDFTILKGTYYDPDNRLCALFHKPDNCYSCMPFYAPYQRGDILYVRETWRIWRARRYEADIHIEFKAGGKGSVLQFQNGRTDSINRADYDYFLEKWGKWGIGTRWHPSIHMPKEAARIFLRVTDVRVERLQDITEEQVKAEGVDCYYPLTSRLEFYGLWDRTIKPADRAIYGWEANPWVWVIEFKRIRKKEIANA